MEGTELDKEAFKRGTSVYLSDRRIDMIPELLSSNLCSLKYNEDRLAFSIIWTFDLDGKSTNQPPKFFRSVIRSKSSLTYQEAQTIIDDQANKNDNISLSLRNLLKISKIMRDERTKNGALVLSSTEVRFEVDILFYILKV